MQIHIRTSILMLYWLSFPLFTVRLVSRWVSCIGASSLIRWALLQRVKMCAPFRMRDKIHNPLLCIEFIV